MISIKPTYIGWSLFALVLLLGDATLHAQAIKSVDYMNYERPEDADSLQLRKREYKEYNGQGQLVKYVLHTANPIGDLVKNSEIIKEQLDEGRTEFKITYDEMGEPERQEKKYFDDDNILVKEEYTDFLQTPAQPLVDEYEYKKGLVAKIITYTPDGKKIGQQKWKYNSSDEEVRYQKEMTLNGVDMEEEKRTYYDRDGNMEKVETTRKEGDDKFKEIVLFERNQMVEWTKYKNGEITSQFNKYASAKSYDPSKARTMVSFGGWAVEDEYDDLGRKVRTVEYTDDEVSKEIEYEYDDDDNITLQRETSYEGNFTIVKEDRKSYDEYGNPTRTALYQNGELLSEQRYSYEYH